MLPEMETSIPGAIEASSDAAFTIESICGAGGAVTSNVTSEEAVTGGV